MMLRNQFKPAIFEAKSTLPKKRRSSVRSMLEEESRSKKFRPKTVKPKKRKAPIVY